MALHTDGNLGSKLEMYHWSNCWTFLIYIIFTLAPSMGNSDRADAFDEMIAAFDTDTRHIRSAISSIEDVKRESQQRQNNLCRGMGPNNHPCGLTSFDVRNVRRGDDEDIEVETLNRGTRSLKGSRSDNPPTEKERMAYIAKLAKRRQDMDRILELLNEKENNIRQIRKRTCAVELGGACRTEWASAIADQYYYLMGPHGPGKRRRRSLINVLTGKLSHISTSNKGH